MQLKRTNADREAILNALEQRFWQMSIDDLYKLKVEWSLGHAKGKLQTGEWELDAAALNLMHNICLEKRRQRREAGPTPEYEETKQVKELMRQHGVSEKTARNYIKRQQEKQAVAANTSVDDRVKELMREHYVSEKTARAYVNRHQIKQAPPIEPDQQQVNEVDNTLGMARADARIQRAASQ